MRLKPEMLWKQEPEIEAARKLPGWVEFHRACGRLGFFFDHPERVGGRRSDWVIDCFTAVKNRRGLYENVGLSQGRGRTVVDALRAAHDACDRRTTETAALLARIGGAGVEEIVSEILEDLIG